MRWWPGAGWVYIPFAEKCHSNPKATRRVPWQVLWEELFPLEVSTGLGDRPISRQGPWDLFYRASYFGPSEGKWPTGNHDLWFWNLLKWGLDCASLENVISSQSSWEVDYLNLFLVTNRILQARWSQRNSFLIVSETQSHQHLVRAFFAVLSHHGGDCMEGQRNHGSKVTFPFPENPLACHGALIITWWKASHGGGYDRVRQGKYDRTSHLSFNDKFINPSWMYCPHNPVQLYLSPKGHNSKCQEHINWRLGLGMGHLNHGRW